MSSTGKEFAQTIDYARTDRSAEVGGAHQSVVDILSRVNRAALPPQESGQMQRTEAQLQSVGDEFLQAYGSTRPEIDDRAKKLKSGYAIRRLVEVVVLVLAVVLLFTKALWLGIVLLVALLVARPIVKKNFLKKARELAAESQLPAEKALAQLGRPQGGLLDASGLCAQADALYLVSLDQHQAALEQQRRLSERQMAQMQAHHDEQMAVQQAAMAKQQQAMEALITGSEATNDALYGKPGFIGSTLRSYDRAKRRQS